MPVTGPNTNFLTVDSNTGLTQDLGQRYVSLAYMMDVYPNLIPGMTSPGLWLYGDNQYGELGQNNITNYSSPVQVGLLTNWKQVACGQYHTAGIQTPGY